MTIAMKIEEIEKLNSEKSADYGFYSTFSGGTGYEEGMAIATAEDIAYTEASPTITAQYIKARRFEVTEEFVEKVDSLISTWQYEHPRIICKAVLETMWEEIEND